MKFNRSREVNKTAKINCHRWVHRICFCAVVVVYSLFRCFDYYITCLICASFYLYFKDLRYQINKYLLVAFITWKPTKKTLCLYICFLSQHCLAFVFILSEFSGYQFYELRLWIYSIKVMTWVILQQQWVTHIMYPVI